MKSTRKYHPVFYQNSSINNVGIIKPAIKKWVSYNTIS